MKFTKMNGLGNDYIYIDTMQERVENPSLLAKKLSDRHFSVGGDGVVLIGSSKKADFSMRMFNADGSEGEMCGNAIRCVGKYLFDRGYTKKTTLAVETLAGIKVITLIKNAVGIVDQVRVNMGKVAFVSESEPVVALEAGGREFIGYRVDAGNPHCVILVDDYHDIMRYGALISENTDIFPDRTNVEFVLKGIKNDRITMRVYERGAGETLACGTGASAVFYLCNRLGLVGDRADVVLLGGVLRCSKVGDEVYIEGGAEYNFEGEIL